MRLPLWKGKILNSQSNKKALTVTIPCYNSAEYMDHCLQTLIDGSVGHHDKLEIIVVDDGSQKDNTLEKARDWEKRYPDVVRAIHQENAGHGGAVNKGIANATGTYFKVVDSDDWVDEKSFEVVMEALEASAESDDPLDMLLCNYVYENVELGQDFVDYKKVLPVGKVFTWDDIGKFPVDTYILMHSVFYRTEVLHDCGVKLPEHTFYVDNIFVYVPLPYVRKMMYLDLDLYRYFIGREDQSVNEKVMIGRIEQQLKITRVMIDAYDLDRDITNSKLRDYMENYLLMMMTISSVFSLLSDRPDRLQLRDGIWKYLEDNNPGVYQKMRNKFLGRGTNLKGEAGRRFTIGAYKVAQKIFKFN